MVYEEVEVPWYENFKEGDKVICWVSDFERRKNYINIIVKVESLEDGRVVCLSDTTTWSWAAPLTVEELEQFNGNYLK
jgi:hypothetical protein